MAEGKPRVFVVIDGKAKAVAVAAGETRDADQLLTGGLKGGETVVLAPDKLQDGQRVVAKQE
jgi:hypothetical protein